MKKNLTWIGLIIVLAFSLSMFAGCAEKKSVVKEGAAQDQQVTSDQAAKDAAAKAETDRLARERAEREAADRLAKESAEKEQVAKVEAAATSATEDAIKDIYFDFDKSNIRPDAREVLKANADYFLKNSATSMIVEGNCDERGTAEYNMALGQRRAAEAKKYLVNLGVKESKIKTISYGKERPIDAGHDEDAWAKNRRDHFVVKVK
jgi:peptidoglycan-associated lipoprotein